jgi:hypothetical protein
MINTNAWTTKLMLLLASSLTGTGHFDAEYDGLAQWCGAGYGPG